MRVKKYIVMVIMSFVLAGCAINNKTFGTKSETFGEAQELFLRGELVLGLQKLEQAAQEQPENKEIRTVLARQRDEVPIQMVMNANHFRLSGDLDTAEEMYHHILEFFPRHERAEAGLEALELERHHIASLDYAQELLTLNDVTGAEKTVRTVLQENPEQPYARQLIKQIGALVTRSENKGLTLETAFKKPFTIEFRDTDLKTVFEVMAKTAGINFVFDKDIRQEAKMSIFVRDNSVEDILNLILMTNQLAYKALNDNSLLIYPNTPAKQKEYQELVVRSFPVAYADVKQMVAMVRGLVKAKDIYVNEQLNLFIMRDTLEAIRVVERLVALNDMPEPEVMLEVVILTVSRNNSFQLGPNLPTSVSFGSVLDAATGLPISGAQPITQLGFDGLKNFSLPTSQARIDFSHILSNGDILANPRIRVKNREAAKIHIGTRFPVFSSNISAGVSAVVTSTPTYLDLGIKLDVEPIIGLHDDVTMKVTLEVSQKGDDIPAPSTGSGGSGGSAPVITTSNAETLMTLKDGETQVLAGLIENEETRGVTGLAGLLNIPGLDRLTSNQKVERKKREIILLITPRVVRNIIHPSNFDRELHFGTANMPGKLPVTISKTAASSLAIASAGTGRGGGSRGTPTSFSPNNESQATPNPFARSAASSPTITLQAPANVGLDKEFSVRVGLVGATASLTSEAELSYDSSTLEIVGEEDNSGTYALKLGKGGASGRTAQIRFKVIAVNPGTTDLTIQNSSAEDADTQETVEVTLPTTSTVNIQ